MLLLRQTITQDEWKNPMNISSPNRMPVTITGEVTVSFILLICIC